MKQIYDFLNQEVARIFAIATIPASIPFRERAFFQPTGSEDNLVDEEEEEMPSFEMAIRKNTGKIFELLLFVL